MLDSGLAQAGVGEVSGGRYIDDVQRRGEKTLHVIINRKGKTNRDIKIYDIK